MRAPFTVGKSRIEALSDGVFAIAMTLLVLKLEVPEVMHHMTNADMLEQLFHLGPAFITYVVTFLIAGGFWFLHHLTFHFIRQVDAFLVWVNLVFLMFVSLLPFSAGLMSHLLVHPVSQLFYFGNHLAIALLLALHWSYAARRTFLQTSDSGQTSRLSYRIGTTVAAFAGALLTAWIAPSYSGLGLAIVLCGGAIVEWFSHRRRR